MANPLPLVAPRNFILRIKVHCSKCENKTKLFLLTIPGLHSATIDRKQGTVTISGTVKPSRIITLLEKGMGLKAELLWDQTPTTSSSSSPTDAEDLQIVSGRSRIVAENNDLQRFVDSNDQMMSQLKQISRIQGLESIEIKLNFRQENPTVKDKNDVEVVVHHGGGGGNNSGGGELCSYHLAHGYPVFNGFAMHGNMQWPPYASGCVPQPGPPPPWGGGYSPSAPPNYDDAPPPPPPAPARDGSFFNQFSDDNTSSCIVM